MKFFFERNVLCATISLELAPLIVFQWQSNGVVVCVAAFEIIV